MGGTRGSSLLDIMFNKLIVLVHLAFHTIPCAAATLNLKCSSVDVL